MLQAWGLPEDVVTLVKMHHHGAPDPLGVTIEVAEEIAQPGLRTDRDQLGAAAGDRQRRQLLAFLARVEPDGPAPGRAAST